jgi:hypothetical protein
MIGSLRWSRRFVMTAALFFLAASPCYAIDPVEEQTQAFLTAYANGDSASVLSAVGAGTVIYGSDAAEVFRGPVEVRAMLENDRKLWGGSARIGPMQQVSVIHRGDLASIFFDAPFSAGGRPPVLVRFALVWTLTNGHWLLEQASNTVPTTGQSAAELLARPAR